MTLFFRWFLFFVSIVSIVFVGDYLFGVFEYVKNNDATRLSWVIVTLFIVTNLWIGKKNFEIDHEVYMDRHDTQKAWWAADACMALGMIGTLAGMLIVLNTAFVNVDVASTQAMKEVIGTLASGMGTALLTSLIGLITSFTLKYELVSLEYANENV